MQILLANAKIMVKNAPLTPLTTPRFQDITNRMALEMSSLDIDDMERMLGCNRKLATENLLRYRDFFSTEEMPAIMAYNGQAYKHLKASTLSPETLQFAQNHLWITCFLYGLLRPMDGVVPYRMEHTVRLESTGNIPLNRYWRKLLTEVLIDSVKQDDGILIHLSTGEYEQLFDWQRICNELMVIQPLFYVKTGNRMKMQAVWAKACRGAMTRFIIENRLSQPQELTAFSYEGFTYAPQLGESAFPHFVRM